MSWLIANGTLQIAWGSLSSEVLARFSRHEPMLRDRGLLQKEIFRATWDEWARLGALPQTDEEEFLADWAALQDALADALRIELQVVDVRSVGFVGAAGAGLVLSVNGTALPTGDPFQSGWDGAPPLPAAAQAQQLLFTSPKGTRQEQIARWARLRAHLETATTLLAPGLALRFDEHLKSLKVRIPSRFGLAWKTSGRDEAVATLEVSAVEADGSKTPIDLAGLDPETGIVSGSASAPILLPDAVSAVATSARQRQRQVRRKVEGEMRDPACVIPEGVDADRLFDLSEYSSRVKGFELATRRDSPFGFVSPGAGWFDDSASGGPFLELVLERFAGDAQTRVCLETIEEAQELLDRNETALGQADASSRVGPSEIEHRGIRVRSSRELSRTLARAIEMHGERLGAEQQRGHVVSTTPGRGRYVAVIGELAATSMVDQDGIVIDESLVPWNTLGALMNPSFSLKAHQRRGVAWLWHHAERMTPGVLLADDMGLGKTLQVAAFVALRIAAGEERPALIVAPTILLDAWIEELERFFVPDTFTTTLVLHGPGLRRFRSDAQTLDVEAIGRARLVLTNYETLASHQLSLLRVSFSTAVFDEAQALKNETTLRSRAAQGLKRSFAVALTGTPVENRLSDLWAVFESVEQRADSRSFGDRHEFEQEYEESANGIEAVRRRLRFPSPSSPVLRREKSEALRDLPPKHFHETRIAMTQLQYELERVIARELRILGPLGMLDRLRKLYQHPCLLDRERRIRLSVGEALEESPKMGAALNLLRDIAARGEKALVFTQWVRMQDLLAQLFTAELRLPRVSIINGSPENRSGAQRVIREFSAERGFGVLILSPLAAGVGLTITAANHVIHYGRWWNAAREDQATDRAYRIGQTRPVHVHHLLLHHPHDRDRGFDLKLHELVERRRRIARDFLAPAGAEREPTAELDAMVTAELEASP